METDDFDKPFDTIESAQDFMQVLGDTVLDSMKDLSRGHAAALRDGQDRRAQAIELAEYKLKMLGSHIQRSRRLLNDLRILRRLILDERQTVDRLLATL